MKPFEDLRREVSKMLPFHTPANIATSLNVPFEDVMEVVELRGMPRRAVTLICGKTGKTWHCQSFRSAYLRVCAVGLTKWTWHFTSDWQAWMEANA